MVAVQPTATMASSSLLLRPRALFRRALPPPPPSSRRALPAPRLQAAKPSLSARGEGERRQPAETRLYSLAPYPLLLAALLPGAEPVTAVFAPFVELVKTWDLPGWLVHWGHPGNMAVVLFAMGGYGTYLGFRIKLSDDPEEKAKAKDLHPKLLALGATGGVTGSSYLRQTNLRKSSCCNWSHRPCTPYCPGYSSKIVRGEPRAQDYTWSTWQWHHDSVFDPCSIRPAAWAQFLTFG